MRCTVSCVCPTHTPHTGSVMLHKGETPKFQELQSQFHFPESHSKVCQGGDFVKGCIKKILSVTENVCLPGLTVSITLCNSRCCSLDRRQLPSGSTTLAKFRFSGFEPLPRGQRAVRQRQTSKHLFTQSNEWRHRCPCHYVYRLHYDSGRRSKWGAQARCCC